MLANQVRLPLPTKLNFGSDPRPGFTDPRRYDSSRSRTSGSPGSSSSRHEKLPSVNQLLTPASPPRPSELNRAQKPEPLPPTEAAARHLYGWSKGGLEGLHPRSGYLPPQAVLPHPPSQFPAAQYPTGAQYPGPGMGSTEMGPGAYAAAPGGLPPFPPPHDPAGYRHQQYKPQFPGPLRDPMDHPSSPDPTSPTKPVPKLLGEQLFPGEGPCFVYDDGTHVRKVIDGELVNGQWGVTKAGKPRKRLAIACLTCREKKIKCDPAEPKCVQCEKSGRECRFASA
ncbi:MAG: hypothetical protein LQ340_007119 [Diploschistes diacapsis]|nr:MAG: hypothetical protein LQ340_007119 [Diploschistes diacapsis]